MTKTTLVYKVVSLAGLNATLQSSFCWGNGRQNTVRYKVGETVTPTMPDSKLFAFATMEDARHYKNSMSGDIYVAEATNVKATKLIGNTQSLLHMVNFWVSRKRKTKPPEDEVVPAPKGSVLCDSLKLLVRV